MRVGIFHNRYIHRGGEDAVVDAQAELLRKDGHTVLLFQVDNRDEISGSAVGAVRAGLRARWNPRIGERVGAILDREFIDVGHVHNFFPLLTPAVHQALYDRGIPVVQTLHNYRLICANGLLLRSGGPCDDCVVRGPWNAVRHGCYRGSRLQTAVWAEQTALHRRRRTWHRLVDRFTTPSEFARGKLLEAGLPENRLVVQPNPVRDPGEPRFGGRGAVYVGRLSREKGVHLLLAAWRRLDGLPLAIVGSGPEEDSLRRQALDLPGVRFVGERDRDGVIAALAAAAFAVAPSIAFETFGLAVAEAMACGTPSIVPADSALAGLVDHGRSGLHFASGDPVALAQACRRIAENPADAERMGREARADYEESLSPAVARDALVSLYEQVVRDAPARAWRRGQ
ncbi:MAG: glycosyltransferase family 4 protein [Myxococcota bacterium]